MAMHESTTAGNGNESQWHGNGHGDTHRGKAVPPHAVAAERALLGALLLNNELFEEVDEKLRTEDFYDTRHKIMYEKMLIMNGEGHVDPLLLAARLDRDGALKQVGGSDYIAEIADIGAAAVNVPAYVELVREAALLRGMLGVMSAATAEVFRPGDKKPAKLLDETESRLSDVSLHFLDGQVGVQKIQKVAAEYCDKILKVINEKNFHELEGVHSGYATLDKMTTGFHGGDLVIVAGRPGAGKTAFALNLVRHISAENYGVVMFSLEMSDKQLVMRLLSQEGISMQKMRTGRNMELGDITALCNASSNLEKRDIYIDDRGVVNVLEIKTRTRRVRRELAREKKKLGLVVVDYLQLLDSSPGDKNDSRALEVSTISRGLKAMAKELDVPVLALSQLNRSVEGRANKEPVLSDLRESGAIEQDADLILFLHQKQDAPAYEESPTEQMDLIIGKQRNGPTGRIRLNFQKRFSRFTEDSVADESF